MSRERAVLWDMDGTLIDSEEFHWIAWRDTLAKEGIAISREQFLRSFGQRNDTILREWLDAAATPERIEQIGSAKEELYRELVRKNGMQALPGVAYWIHSLHEERWLQAVASAAPRENIQMVLDALNAGDWFQAIVSAEDVRCGKPHPDVFLTAACRVGVPPARCVVVEDAAAGIEAARRAGMRSIGVSRNGKHLPADVVVKSLDLLAFDAFERTISAGEHA